ncbi:MAG: GGDEF domain-containing protein [Sarcina sp.]
MNKKLQKLDLLFVLFILGLFILFSFIFLSKSFDNFIDFMLFGGLILVLIIAYFEKIIWGLLSSIFLIFIYASYEIYCSFKFNISISGNVYFWILIIPVLAFIVGKISEYINEIQDKNKELISKYNDLVTIDHTTGLKNLKAFYIDLEKEISRVIRHHNNLSLIVIKIPFLEQLKSILKNQEYNFFMERLAIILKESTRNEDSIYNLEEDTLAIMMVDANLQGAEIVKNRIKEKIDKENFKLKSSGKNVILDLKIGTKEYNKSIKSAFEFKELTEQESIYDL